jgi:hypothetical protein
MRVFSSESIHPAVRSRSRATFVCITGSSAKSSTTAILSHILAGLAPVYSQVPDNTLEDCVETLRKGQESLLKGQPLLSLPGLARQSSNHRSQLCVKAKGLLDSRLRGNNKTVGPGQKQDYITTS